MPSVLSESARLARWERAGGAPYQNSGTRHSVVLRGVRAGRAVTSSGLEVVLVSRFFKSEVRDETKRCADRAIG